MESNTQKLKKHFTADLRPAYYDSFQCFADKCQVTCCAGWNINFNRKDYLKIRQQKGSDPLNSAIKDALQRTKSTDPNFYATFRLQEDGCPLQTENGLCRLQQECGYDVLPKVCKVFPRRKTYSASGYFEYSLSPACEAVLELLWNLPEGIDFVSDPLPKTQWITKTGSVENLTLASYFQEIRSLCIGLLQDRRFPLRERILLMGIFLQKLTAENVDIPAWLQQTEQMLQLPELAAITSPLFAAVTEDQQYLILMQHIKTLLGIQKETVHKELLTFIQMVEEQLIRNMQIENTTCHITLHIQKFKEITATFSEAFAEREYLFENLMVSVFFYLLLPSCHSGKNLWKSYVNFCNLYSLFHFMAICSYLEPAETESDAKANLFRGILCISREMLHSAERQNASTSSFFDYENDSLAHMAMLLSL